jgi:hypothetical protein
VSIINKNSIYLEDNQGGDCIAIRNNGDGKYTFEVARCCVYSMRKTGTISEICDWLTELTFLLPEGTESVEHI